MLSNKENRRLYDGLGHEAFLKNDASVDSEDEHETSFHFSFSDLFQDFDDSPFGDDTHFHWSFPQDWDDEEGPYEHFSFEGAGYHFYFGDGDENEEENQY